MSTVEMNCNLDNNGIDITDSNHYDMNENYNVEEEHCEESPDPYYSSEDEELNENPEDHTQDDDEDEDEDEYDNSEQQPSYEVVFFVNYIVCRPKRKEIEKYFSNYGIVDHVKCVPERDFVFVYMEELSCDTNIKRTRTTIHNIINDMLPTNRFIIKVARPRYNNQHFTPRDNRDNRFNNYHPQRNYQNRNSHNRMNYRDDNYQPRMNYRNDNYQPRMNYRGDNYQTGMNHRNGNNQQRNYRNDNYQPRRNYREAGNFQHRNYSEENSYQPRRNYINNRNFHNNRANNTH